VDTFDVATNKNDPGIVVIDRSDSQAAAGTLPLGVNFTNTNGPTSPEIEALSYQWGGSGTPTVPRFQDFQLDLGDAGSPDPEILGALLSPEWKNRFSQDHVEPLTRASSWRPRGCCTCRSQEVARPASSAMPCDA